MSLVEAARPLTAADITPRMLALADLDLHDARYGPPVPGWGVPAWWPSGGTIAMDPTRACLILNAHRHRGAGDWHHDPQYPGHFWSSAGVIHEAEAIDAARKHERRDRRTPGEDK